MRAVLNARAVPHRGGPRTPKWPKRPKRRKSENDQNGQNDPKSTKIVATRGDKTRTECDVRAQFNASACRNCKDEHQMQLVSRARGQRKASSGAPSAREMAKMAEMVKTAKTAKTAKNGQNRPKSSSPAAT